MTGTGTPILRIDGFYDGVVTGLTTLKRVRVTDEEQSLYGLHPGEIVINRVNSREYLGKSAQIPFLSEPIVFESNMMRFDIDHTRLDSCLSNSSTCRRNTYGDRSYNRRRMQ